MSPDSDTGAGNQHQALGHLASICGIGGDWWDSLGNHHVVSEGSLRHLLTALGVLDTVAASDAQISAALERERQAPWSRSLPAVRVLYDGEPSGIETVVAEQDLSVPLTWRVRLESGQELDGEVAPNDLDMAGVEGGGTGDSRGRLNDRALQLRWLGLPGLPIGYHRIEIEQAASGLVGEAHLIVAPRRCHEPATDGKSPLQWGLSVQLYALKSGSNGGFGHFGDLTEALRATHALGGQILGINPLHALFAHAPEEASPYSPSSRVFLNPWYIDVQQLPGHTGPDSDGGSGGEDPAGDDEFIDYSAMARRKQAMLEAAFSAFEQSTACATDREAFDHWQASRGESLHRYASFEMLRELGLADAGASASDWRQWQPDWQDPDSPVVAALVAAHAGRIRFHTWLQWVANEQLESAAAVARELGLGIGLYRDLAVGIAANGADAWMDQSVYMQGVHVGAPPDEFSVQGQDWGLPPMNPRELQQRGYAPFRAMLQANVAAAGALRIDHVMGLARLFCIPSGGTPTDGAYVSSNLDDMLAVLAIESVRAACVIIGEDLGTVPEGFRERLQEAGVLSYRLLYFEKHYDSDHRFRLPDEYVADALVTANTHDLPTLAGFWLGSDIELRAQRQLFPSTELHERQQQDRVADRYRLLAVLASQGLLPEGVDANQPDETLMDERLIDAVYQYLARTPSRLLVINVEDIIGVTQQMNLPGTDRDRYPNWRRRLPIPVDQWATNPRFKQTAELMRQQRPESGE